jgi:hypothetical protein
MSAFELPLAEGRGLIDVTKLSLAELKSKYILRNFIEKKCSAKAQFSKLLPYLNLKIAILYIFDIDAFMIF